jgi:pimeloyl-ACP methyl ester carboxylesterase
MAIDALSVPSAIVVGHDWGAAHAWNAALMRPDRFKAVFCMSVPYVPRGDVSVFERMRKSGHQNDFYMFEQIRPGAIELWADAAVTILQALPRRAARALGGENCNSRHPRATARDQALAQTGTARILKWHHRAVDQAPAGDFLGSSR